MSPWDGIRGTWNTKNELCKFAGKTLVMFGSIKFHLPFSMQIHIYICNIIYYIILIYISASDHIIFSKPRMLAHFAVSHPYCTSFTQYLGFAYGNREKKSHRFPK